MGMASVFASLVKGITWTKVASMALEYGPDIYRKAMERFQCPPAPAGAPEDPELQERLARLEKLLLEQEEIIRGEAARNELLEKRCQELEGTLLVLKVVAGLLTLGCIVLLAVLFK